MSRLVTIGLCEDDDELRGIVRIALERVGYGVRALTTGGDAVRAFSHRAPDVVVLDIALPDADGRDVCQALRARGMVAPVLFLTARESLGDLLSGFHAGADDYLTKPFALAELLARIGVLARRAAAGTPDSSGPEMILDPGTHGLSGTNGATPLTPTEFRLLAELAAHSGSVVRRTGLMRVAWPSGAIISDNTLDAYISRLRGKLRRAGRGEEIVNVRGVGYVLR